MRAVVDSPELCATKGLSPNVVTGASWAMGSMLAGLAAILIAPGLNLEVNTLSLLVVSAYAAAVLGRLQNLPMTFAGAVILGVSQAMVVAYLPSSNEWVQNLRPALPFLLLFAALLARGELRLPEKAKTHSEPEPPGLRLSLIVGGIAVVLSIPIAQWIGNNPSQLLTASSGLAFGAITISLVLLTGLSGQVSLMHMSFAGIGAIVVGKLGADFPYLMAIAIAAVVAGLVGAVVALPAIRLRGVYLALSTLAFAILLDELVFGNSDVLGGGTTIAVGRPSIGAWHLDSEEAMFVVLTVVVVVFANVFLAVRRTKFGRMLAAMRDSPGASQMIGMNVTAQKLKVFSLSAAMAGFAGALFGGLQARVGQLDFLWFRSLSVLLVATIFGITSVSGALLGAFFFVVLPDVLREISEGGDSTSITLAFQPLIIGLLAILTARRPEGVAGRIRERLRPILRRTPLIETPEAVQPAKEVARAGT
jgi:branched-chain amino acid transport system permease protein